VIQFNSVFPASVNPGQQAQVKTTITVSCGQWRTYYTGRLDLVDRNSGLILSTTYLDIGQRATYTTTLTDNETAPQTNGPWNLFLNLYIFEEASMVTSSTNHSVGITVGTNSASQPVLATTSQSNATTTLEATSPTNPSFATEDNGTTLWPYAIAALVTVSILAAVLFVRERKRNTGTHGNPALDNAGNVKPTPNRKCPPDSFAEPPCPKSTPEGVVLPNEVH
jgi:hypothetical protein